MLNTGTLLCEQYEIIKTIGKGGMSAVYLAMDRKNSRQCAVKVVERSGIGQDNSVVIQSLAAEASLLKRLSNPHMPQIYDIIETPESFTMVMEYIEGMSLDRVLLEKGPQSVENVIGWGMQVCEVFTYLHEQALPIIYRDMKPANIILKNDGTIKVIDFGTARTQKFKLMWQDTLLIGTVGFAAPEQFGGMGQSDSRSDIYCLGATMYNLLTGKMPNQGMLMSIANTDYLRDAPIGAVLTKCLQDDPNKRYQSARELHQALEQIQNAPARSKPTGWLKRPAPTASGGWQALNGLSGLIKGGTTSGQLNKKETSGWIANGSQPAANAAAAPVSQKLTQAQKEAEPQSPADASGGNMWNTLQWVSILAVVIFGALAVYCALAGGTAAAVTSIVLALVSALGCVYCVMQNRER